MASRFINLNKYEGSGDGTVLVSIPSSNTENDLRKGFVTINNGKVSRTVLIVQSFKPYIEWVDYNGELLDNTAKTIHFNLYSPYPIFFEGIPNWITIKDSDGITYSNGQTMPPTMDDQSVKTGKLYTVTVASSLETSTRETSDLQLFHRVAGVVRQGLPILIRQMSSSPYMEVVPTMLNIDYNSGATNKLNVITNQNYRIISQSQQFSVKDVTFPQVGSREYDIMASSENNSHSVIEGVLNVMTITRPSNTFVNVKQLYKPYITSSASTGHLPKTGGSYTFTVHSEYDWWTVSNDDSVTFKDANGNKIDLGQVMPGGVDFDVTMVIPANTDPQSKTWKLGLGIARADGTDETIAMAQFEQDGNRVVESRDLNIGYYGTNTYVAGDVATYCNNLGVRPSITGGGDWCTVILARNAATGAWQIKVSVGKSALDRTTWFKVSSPDGAYEITYNVHQSQLY